MIPKERMIKLAEGLLEKTRNRQASWQPDSLYDFSYILDLPHSRIRVALDQKSNPFNKVVTLTVSDANDVGVGTLEGGMGEYDAHVLDELFTEASRVATRWDKVLEEVETALNSKGPIGLSGK
jgi:hypothetical protein